MEGVYTCNCMVTSVNASRVESRHSDCSLPVVSGLGFRLVTSVRVGLGFVSCSRSSNRTGQWVPTAITAGAARVASGPLCVHATAITPTGLMELVRSSIPIDDGLPCVSQAGSCNCFFEACCVYSCYGLHARRVAKRSSTPKAPTASSPPLPLRLLPGGANQFPGGSYTR